MNKIYLNLVMAQWHLHNEHIENAQVLKSHLSTIAWWKEVGAFILTASRQQGKTTFLKQVEKELHDKNEQTLFLSHKDDLLSSDYFNAYQIHLLIDEYNYRKDLNEILSYNWKSVTMAGSLI